MVGDKLTGLSYQWFLNRSNDTLKNEWIKSGMNIYSASLLASRQVECNADNKKQITDPRFESLHDPFLMGGMEKAVERILTAVKNNEKVLIYGDYDTDGTTGTTLLKRGLMALGLAVDFYIPLRKEGYGLNWKALSEKIDEGYTLVISTDCGITAHDQAQKVFDAGIDLIITDHHLPDESEAAPTGAYAVLNPHLNSCPYPDKNLAGVGVAFKLIHALLIRSGKAHLAVYFLQLVCIGTVVDMADLTGENRLLTKLGLEMLPGCKNFGLRALMNVSGLEGKEKITSTDLGFQLGPRINAAGRLRSASAIVELFECSDYSTAIVQAMEIDELNKSRKGIQESIFVEALALAESKPNAKFLILANKDWHKGVVGITANKIVERTGKPVLLLGGDEEQGILSGSARSVDGYHLLDALHLCKDLLISYGGHEKAAGAKLNADNLEQLESRLNAHADQNCPTFQRLKMDMALYGDDFKMPIPKLMEPLEPFGIGWNMPVFVSKYAILTKDPLIMKDKHMKINLYIPNKDYVTELEKETIRDEDKKEIIRKIRTAKKGWSVSAVWWNSFTMLKYQLEEGDIIDLTYTVENNNFRGQDEMQLNIKDARFSFKEYKMLHTPAPDNQPGLFG